MDRQYLGLIVGIVALLMIGTIRSPQFLSLQNLQSIVLATSILIVVGVGQTLVVMSRNLDLSQGAMVTLVAFTVGLQYRNTGMSMWSLTLLALATGLMLGLLNGVIVSILEVPSIIATLGTMSIFRGVTFVLADGSQISRNDIPEPLISAARAQLLGIPWPFVVAALTAVVAAVLVGSTKPGRTLVAVGSNAAAARLRGLNPNVTVVAAFTLSGVLCALAGLMFMGRFGNVNPSDASGLELQSVAAVIIGGTSIAGGRGKFLGTVLGAVLLGVINNVLIVSNVDPLWQMAVQGLVIVVAGAVALRTSPELFARRPRAVVT